MGLFKNLFNKDENQKGAAINWQTLNSEQDLSAALSQSKAEPIVIFKHSTRCSISSMAKNRLERRWDFEENEGPTMYYLDLIAYRNVSNQIAEVLGVQHESPQIIVVDDEKAIYHTSHSDISVEGLHEVLGK